MRRLVRGVRLGAIGAFFTGILSVIQGCDVREGALFAFVLFVLNFCSGPTTAPITEEAVPPVLYGIAFANPNVVADFYQLNPATGAATLIGSVGFERCSAMDQGPDGTLYAICEDDPGGSAFALITINPATGAGTKVVTLSGGSDPATDISFRNSDGVLFGEFSEVFTVDLVTGTRTFLANSAELAGCCGFGLAFSAADVLYHADDAQLTIADQTTGAGTLVAGLSYPAPADDFPRVNAMDFHPQTGVLFASIVEGGGAGGQGVGPKGDFLGTINIGTGDVTVIGTTVVGLDALAWFVAP